MLVFGDGSGECCGGWLAGNTLGNNDTTNDDCNMCWVLTESNGYAPSDARGGSGGGGGEEGLWREEANEAAGRRQRFVQDSQARDGPQSGPCNHLQLRQEVSIVHCMRPRRVNGGSLRWCGSTWMDTKWLFTPPLSAMKHSKYTLRCVYRVHLELDVFIFFMDFNFVLRTLLGMPRSLTKGIGTKPLPPCSKCES